MSFTSVARTMSTVALLLKEQFALDATFHFFAQHPDNDTTGAVTHTMHMCIHTARHACLAYVALQ